MEIVKQIENREKKIALLDGYKIATISMIINGDCLFLSTDGHTVKRTWGGNENSISDRYNNDDNIYYIVKWKRELKMARKYTNKLWGMMEEGIVSYEHVVSCCLKYMSEDDVKDMMECNELILEEDEDE